MAAEHHLSDEILLEYASGALAEGWSLAVAAHLTLCPSCRERVGALEDAGAAAFEELPTAALGDEALEACLARLDERGPDEDVPSKASECAVLPAPVTAYLDGDLDSVAWSRVGGGVRQKLLPVEGDVKARLLWIPPGAEVPEHGHGGRELTLVFAGSYVDGADVFRRGDIQEADGDVEHTPVSGAEEACVCLAVTDAPLRFTRFIPRVVQRFARI